MKLEEYKFGLPTLLIAAEREIYQKTKHEIDLVRRNSRFTYLFSFLYFSYVMVVDG